MKRNRVLTLIFSLAVSAGLVGLLLSKIETDKLVFTLKNIHVPLLILFMVLSLGNTALRTLRYKWLLLPRKVSFGSLFLVTMVRNLFVDLFPARIGSLSYVYLAIKSLRLPFEGAASSFLLAMIFDFITLSPFLILSVLFVGVGVTALSGPMILIIAAAFFVFMGLILRFLPAMTAAAARFYKAILNKIGRSDSLWAKSSLEKLRMTVISLEEIKARGIFGKILGLTLVLRITKYGALFFLLAALMKIHTLKLFDLSLWKTILGITAAELTSILPVKGIGGFGTWESAWTLAFKLMNYNPELAIISGISLHLITNLFEYFLGIIAILILALPIYRKHVRNSFSLPDSD